MIFRYSEINPYTSGFEISSLSGWESIVVQGYAVYENYCDVAYCEDFISASEYNKRDYPKLKNGKVDPIKAMFTDRGGLITKNGENHFFLYKYIWMSGLAWTLWVFMDTLCGRFFLLMGSPVYFKRVFYFLICCSILKKNMIISLTLLCPLFLVVVVKMFVHSVSNSSHPLCVT